MGADIWWRELAINVAAAVSGSLAAELHLTAGDMQRSTLRTLLLAAHRSERNPSRTAVSSTPMFVRL